MHASCLQMLPNFTQALQSAAARRRNLSSPGTSLGFKNPRINPVPIAEPTNARDLDLHARGTIITAKKNPIPYKQIIIVFQKICLSFVHNNHQFTTNHDTIRAILISIGLLVA